MLLFSIILAFLLVFFGDRYRLLEFLLTAILVAYFSYLPTKLERRQKEISQINAALAAFENSRKSLLNFKGYHLAPYSKEINALKKRSKKIDDKFLANHPHLHMRFTVSGLNNANYSETLAFLVSYDQELISLLHDAQLFLAEVQNFIIHRNKLLKQFIDPESSEYLLTEAEQKRFLSFHEQYLTTLLGYVDAALVYHENCSNRTRSCLRENYFINELKIHTFHHVTDYEDLMPKDSDIHERSLALV